MDPNNDDTYPEGGASPTEPAIGESPPADDAADASCGPAVPVSPDWVPTQAPAGSRSSVVFGALAVLVAVALVAASVVGYLFGRRGSTRASSSNGAPSFSSPALNNGNNGNNGSNGANGSGLPFGNGFGGPGRFGPSAGDGSPSFGAPSSRSSSSGTTSAKAQKVAAQVDPAIVDVTSTLPNGVGKGTGMVVTSDGEILTNNHVVSGATSIQVQFVTTGKSYSASLVGYDASHDVALLTISHVSGLTTIATTRSANIRSGQSVVVIGNANGQDGTPAVVDGVVTATNKTITASDETGYESETLSGLVELSANVVSGDSGGAVTDSNGHVIAMTTAVWAANGNAVSFNSSGDAYAIPIDTALSVVHQIESGQASSTVHLGPHGLLGVGVQDVNGGGAYVAEVASGSAAERAGLTQGDTITAVNGTTITSTDALNAAMAATHVGDHITVQWQDASGSSHQATVTLATGVA